MQWSARIGIGPDRISCDTRIQSPRKSDPGRIRYASESNPVLAKSYEGGILSMAKSIRGATKSTIDFQE